MFLIPILRASDSLGIERSRCRGIEACREIGSSMAALMVEARLELLERCGRMSGDHRG